ncbi:oxidoreductase [Gynuella sunshinyii]|uniref:Putative dehydrogenase-related protein n=1 Tax=Gynuella sunshinyii YC6258 TaxID=1445510 RepID=A0A0C5VSQ0_9GAMM|nr:oxidoreductase [Gynuella sunshinyii]AJQ93314.1 putative dehydrogenase-related protein [Gynuella sunshinyii YC6258]
MIKTVIVGYGYSARTFHLPFLRLNNAFDVVGFVSSRPEEILATYPVTQIFSQLSECLQRLKPDLVIVTTPNHLHFSQAKSALLAGAHVVVEKPFTLTTTEAHELIELARRQQKKLTVFHNRRWDGDFLTVKKLITSGKLGEIKIFESRFDRFRPQVRDRWRENAGPGSGIFWDLAPHLIDQAITLFGLPTSTHSQLYTLRDSGESTDAFHLTLNYPDKVVYLSSSPFQAGDNERFNIQGTLGSFRKYGLDPQEAQLKQGLTPGTDDWGMDKLEYYGTLFTEQEKKSLKTEIGCYEQFFLRLENSILKNTDEPVIPETIFPVIEIIENAITSI